MTTTPNNSTSAGDGSDDEPTMLSWLESQGVTDIPSSPAPDSAGDSGEGSLGQDTASPSETGPPLSDEQSDSPVSRPQRRQSWMQELSDLDPDAAVERSAEEPEKTDYEAPSTGGFDHEDELTPPTPLPRRRGGKKIPHYLDERTYTGTTDPVQEPPADTRPGSGRFRHSANRGTAPRTKRARTWLPTDKWRVLTVAGGVATLCAVAVVVAVQMMSDVEPVTPAPAAQQSVPAMTSSVDPADFSSDGPTGPGERDESVGGTCSDVEDRGLPIMRSGQRDPRGAWVTYNAELYGKNPAGVLAVLAGDSSMRDQDWKSVMTQIPEDATFCLEMQPLSGNRMQGSLEVTGADGQKTVYKQRATAVEIDGRWFIQEIKKDSSNS